MGTGEGYGSRKKVRTEKAGRGGGGRGRGAAPGGEGKQIHESTGKKSGRHCSELPTPGDLKRGDVTAIPARGPRPPRPPASTQAS